MKASEVKAGIFIRNIQYGKDKRDNWKVIKKYGRGMCLIKRETDKKPVILNQGQFRLFEVVK